MKNILNLQDREGRKPLSAKDIHTLAPVKKGDSKVDGQDKASAGAGKDDAPAPKPDTDSSGGAAPAGEGDTGTPAEGGGGQESGAEEGQ